MTRKKGYIHVRLDEDLADYVTAVLKERPGGISRFVNDVIRKEKEQRA